MHRYSLCWRQKLFAAISCPRSLTFNCRVSSGCHSDHYRIHTTNQKLATLLSRRNFVKPEPYCIKYCPLRVFARHDSERPGTNSTGISPRQFDQSWPRTHQCRMRANYYWHHDAVLVNSQSHDETQEASASFFHSLITAFHFVITNPLLHAVSIDSFRARSLSTSALL